MAGHVPAIRVFVRDDGKRRGCPARGRARRTRGLRSDRRSDRRGELRMASLKDMRVRIASTKATQKITKAMQMVAASKLRRAQTAAEAARPYAEKMDAVIANIASGAVGGGPLLMSGTGNDRVHLLLVCTG